MPTLLCAILVFARLSMSIVYLTVLFFSFIFKSFLVLYADRGLVRNGQTDLVLFNQLYWLVVLSFSAFIFWIAIGPNIWRGEYIFQDMNKAMACLMGKMPQFSSEKHTTRRAIGITLLLLLFCRLILAKWQVSQFMKRLCPNGRVSCVGKFRRNVIDISATFRWLLMWCFASLICCLSVDYGRNILSVQAQFWIWNTSEFVCFEGLHFVLPFLLNFPSQGRETSAIVEFYVRKPSFELIRLKITEESLSKSTGKGKGKGKGKNKVKDSGNISPQERTADEAQIIHVREYQ